MFLNSSYRSFWEVASFSYTGGSVCIEEPVIEGFLFFGDSLKELIDIYGDLTGKPSLPSPMGSWHLDEQVCLCKCPASG